jgi:hypothetical protein
MKYIVSFLLFLSVFCFFSSPTLAFDPSRPNNKFGIHLADPNEGDLKKASELINSTGGKWGYVTIVIEEKDRDKGKWQDVFNKMRDLHLIPIVRVATKPEGGHWRRPTAEDAEAWAEFLNSLNWVVKERYIILFNEPNHANEWGGAVDPVSFAQVNKIFAEKFKAKSSDFFIMMGGLDAAAPSNRPFYEDSGIYLQAVINTMTPTEFNRLFDGLSSHSYPNPGFVGSPYDTSKRSIRGYQFELDLLKSMGVKDLPVFITETGWNGSALSRETVATNFRIAYESVWLPDPRIVAVTPFVLNYQQPPFLQFSWLREGGKESYPEFEMVKGMSKPAGDPEIIERGIFSDDLPKELVAESTYHFTFKIRNEGQAIWRKEDGYELQLEGLERTSYLIASIGTVQPMHEREYDIFLTTGAVAGQKISKVILSKNGKKIMESNPWTFTVLPLPSLDVNVTLFPKFSSYGDDFEIQVFDSREQLVYKETDVKIEKGKGKIEAVKNIALGRRYKIVILKKYYLPRLTYVTFQKENNIAAFPRMYPLDFDGNGAWEWKNDTGGLLANLSLVTLWIP